MKTEERAFDIYAGQRPKVLLLGNGLCRAYGGISWDRLLDEIKDSQYTRSASAYIMPMPLKAAMLTNNTLATKMRGIVREDAAGTRWSSFTRTTPEMREVIRQAIGKGFDYVLTTNYSYEIEAALLDAPSLRQRQIAALMNHHEVDNAQTQYLINTYNQVGEIPVWHIHGEARKPDSMVIGSFYYGKILRRCVERLDAQKGEEFKVNFRTGKPQKIGSWVDAFVLGDVSILGFGLDFSESDIWWLIEYKCNNPAFCGTTTFYEPDTVSGATCLNDSRLPCDHAASYVDARQCRDLLLTQAYHVKRESCGIVIRDSADYKVFYQKAISALNNA